MRQTQISPGARMGAFWKALAVVGALGALAEVLQYVEGRYESGKAPPWLQMIASIPPPIISAAFMFAIVSLLIWMAIRQDRLVKRLDELSALERRMGSAPRLQIIARTSISVRARFGDREIELEPSAAEYYERDIDEFHREKIHSKIARHPIKYRWERLDFIREVDEKARIRLALDGFIGSGNRLLERAREAAAYVPLSPPPLAPTVLSVVDFGVNFTADLELRQLRSEIESWEQGVYVFLSEETIGRAEEFRSDCGPSKDTEAKTLLFQLETRVDRIRSIKARIG